MADLKKKVEALMSAISFAEAGEFDTAREILKEERRVLLAIRENHLDKKTFKYAINTCKRVGADLDILYVSSSGKISPVLEQCLEDLKNEGINFRVVQKNGCLKQQIIDYTNSKKEVLFAVTESFENLDIDCGGSGKRLSEAWQRLRCPLVVVADSA
jgi:hypothetical protein